MAKQTERKRYTKRTIKTEILRMMIDMQGDIPTFNALLGVLDNMDFSVDWCEAMEVLKQKESA